MTGRGNKQIIKREFEIIRPYLKPNKVKILTVPYRRVSVVCGKLLLGPSGYVI